MSPHDPLPCPWWVWAWVVAFAATCWFIGRD